MSDKPLDLSYKPDLNVQNEVTTEGDAKPEEKDNNQNESSNSKETNKMLANDLQVGGVNDSKFFCGISTSVRL